MLLSKSVNTVALALAILATLFLCASSLRVSGVDVDVDVDVDEASKRSSVPLTTPPPTSVTVNISNVSPRLDTDGQIMDIHDGNTLLINGTYFYYGASYGDCLEVDVILEFVM